MDPTGLTPTAERNVNNVDFSKYRLSGKESTGLNFANTREQGRQSLC